MEELATPAPDPEIPDKLYFRIGEVAKLAGIKPYVLRFWESEFTGLGPKKSGTGHRLYRRKDVELVLEIKRLLYEKRYTIEGARKILEAKPRRPVAKPEPAKPRGQGELFGGSLVDNEILRRLEDVRKGLVELLAFLKNR
jgi:DNA-binding transcriptional MerR regulator